MKTQTLEDVKKMMAPATNVARWNELREKAKAKFPQELINQLDASGYIHEVLKK